MSLPGLRRVLPGLVLPLWRGSFAFNPGAIYHVMNRGDRREAIFADDTDRRRFLETVDEAL